jgi:hypothetical protein
MAQLLMSAASLGFLRRQLRRMYPGVKVSEEELRRLLAAEVIKRDALEGPRAEEATKAVKRYTRRKARAEAAVVPTVAAAPATASLVASR